MLSFPSRERVAVLGGALSLTRSPAGSLGGAAGTAECNREQALASDPSSATCQLCDSDGLLSSLCPSVRPARQPGRATRRRHAAGAPAPALGVIVAVGVWQPAEGSPLGGGRQRAALGQAARRRPGCFPRTVCLPAARAVPGCGRPCGPAGDRKQRDGAVAVAWWDALWEGTETPAWSPQLWHPRAGLSGHRQEPVGDRCLGHGPPGGRRQPSRAQTGGQEEAGGLQGAAAAQGVIIQAE